MNATGILPLVASLAWPTALVVLAVLFRREIGQASGRVRRVRYRDLEVTFLEDLLQVEALARSIPGPVSDAEPAPTLPGPGRPLLEVDIGGLPALGRGLIAPVQPPALATRRKNNAAQATPREVIVEAWAELGQNLIRSAALRGDRRTPGSPMRADNAAAFLRRLGVMTDAEGRLYDALRKVWDQVDQLAGASLSADEARRFAEAAGRLAARFPGRA